MYIYFEMFRRRVRKEEADRIEAFQSFLRSELSQELRLAVKLVQKEAAQSTNQKQEQFTLEIGDTESTRELIVRYFAKP